MIFTIKEGDAINPANGKQIMVTISNVACPGCGGTGRGKASPSSIHAAYSYEKRPGGYQMPDESDEELENQCEGCYGMREISVEISLARLAQLLKEVTT